MLQNNDRAHAVATMRAEDRNVGSINGARQLQHPPLCDVMVVVLAIVWTIAQTENLGNLPSHSLDKHN